MRVPVLVKAALVAVVYAAGLGTDAHAQQERPARSVVLKTAPSPAPATSPPRLARADTTTAPRADPWLAMDKAKHAGGSFLLVLGGQYVFEKKAALGRDPALALSLGAGAVIGLAKEVYDQQVGPTRYFSVRDLVANALGLLLGTGVVLL